MQILAYVHYAHLMAEHIEEKQKHLTVADKNPISSVLQEKKIHSDVKSCLQRGNKPVFLQSGSAVCCTQPLNCVRICSSQSENVAFY